MHGTIGGYQKHIRQGEATCWECRQAWARYYRDRRAKRKAYLDATPIIPYWLRPKP